ncbi:hypothetical protein [Chthonobacter albigriseus]|uniref:hypothetical protein n=1 Tax=Chthonobacter albigriseus TaxID=1683161 RepID=UPI0015EE3DC2|nr:hypothetical protein [Chthonobacter albigriseus]
MVKGFAVACAAAVALVSVAGSAFALDRRVRVINETSSEIREFYASNVGANTWEEDILGQDMLGAGENIIINIDDGTGYCKYDFKAVLEDGREAIQEDVNVCEVATFRFTE